MKNKKVVRKIDQRAFLREKMSDFNKMAAYLLGGDLFQLRLNCRALSRDFENLGLGALAKMNEQLQRRCLKSDYQGSEEIFCLMLSYARELGSDEDNQRSWAI